MDSLTDLGKELNEPSMKSVPRVIILIALAINKKMNFRELQLVASCGKGSLSNHLEKMSGDGLISIRSVLRKNGPGISVSITEKGIEVYKKYKELMLRVLTED